MPTAKHRVGITLDRERYSIVRRAARAQGRSMSALMGDLLDSWLPVLAHVAELHEAKEAAWESGASGQRDFLMEFFGGEEGLEKLGPTLQQLGEAAEAFSVYLDGVAVQRAAAKDGSPDLGDAVTDSQLCNTGVGFEK